MFIFMQPGTPAINTDAYKVTFILRLAERWFINLGSFEDAALLFLQMALKLIFLRFGKFDALLYFTFTTSQMEQNAVNTLQDNAVDFLYSSFLSKTTADLSYLYNIVEAWYFQYLPWSSIVV